MTKKLTGRRCVCRACGQYFNSTSAFDTHRTGNYKKNERRCLSATEMEAEGMVLNQAGFWGAEKMPFLRLYELKTGENESYPVGVPQG